MPTAARRPAAAVAVFAAAFGVVAGLVVSGVLQSVDEYALAHWMPDFAPSRSTILDWHGLWRPFYPGNPWWDDALSVITFPASVLVSGLVFVAGCRLLWPDRPRAAVLWALAWLAGNGFELLGKSLLDRPALHWHGSSIPSFHSSFPSGHTIRATLVAALVIALWRRAFWPAAIWAALTMVLLVVTAAHTPTDVLGGLFVGLGLVFAVRTALGGGE